MKKNIENNIRMQIEIFYESKVMKFGHYGVLRKFEMSVGTLSPHLGRIHACRMNALKLE